MIRIFIDASVLFAAAYSATGASREIIRLAIQGEIRLIVSPLVLEEARRNLGRKVPEALSDLETLVALDIFEVVQPSRAEVLSAAEYVAVKDAPIIAGARWAKADYLLSLDRQHLVGIPTVAAKSGLRIVLPAECLAQIRKR